MRPLSSQDLIEAWERGQGQHPVDRALTLLSVACPDRKRSELAELDVGQRDGLLLALRDRTFGNTLKGFAECPSCSERLEFDLSASDLGAGPESPGDPPELEEAFEGLRIRYRLPNSGDLAAVARCGDVKTGRDLLVRRCLVSVCREGPPVPLENVSGQVLARLEERLAERGAEGEALLDLACPSCRHHWQMVFDIESFFWTEIDAQASRLLREVHTLARAYGWREGDILSLSPSRRRYYLELVS